MSVPFHSLNHRMSGIICLAEMMHKHRHMRQMVASGHPCFQQGNLELTLTNPLHFGFQVQWFQMSSMTTKWLKWIELFQPNTIYIRNHSAMMILNYFIWSVIKAKKILFLLKWNSNLCWRNSNDGLKSLEHNFSSYV